MRATLLFERARARKRHGPDAPRTKRVAARIARYEARVAQLSSDIEQIEQSLD